MKTILHECRRILLVEDVVDTIKVIIYHAVTSFQREVFAKPFKFLNSDLNRVAPPKSFSPSHMTSDTCQDGLDA